MTKIDVLQETPLSMFELKKELEKNKKKEELNFRANKTYEYLQEFSKLKNDQYSTLLEKLEGLKIPRLKEEHIIKIIDTLPHTSEEVKVLFSGLTISISTENMKKIADTVSSVVK